MSDLSDAFLAKAAESLAGAPSEFGNGRYNNVANRAYYAAFQAAIAALDLAGVRPSRGRGSWDHGFVQAQFAGLLIYRRKHYPSDLRDVLRMTLKLRQQGDYEMTPVTATQAQRALIRAGTLIAAVEARAEGVSG